MSSVYNLRKLKKKKKKKQQQQQQQTIHALKIRKYVYISLWHIDQINKYQLTFLKWYHIAE